MSFLDAAIDHAAMLEQWTLCTVEDVPDEQFADQPAKLTNHPAWVLGHLVFALDNVTRQLGGAVGRAEAWYAPFRTGNRPSARRAEYPANGELVTAFKDACARVRRAVADAGEGRLAQPVSDARIAAFFPTLGRWAAHVLLTEGAFHTGQLSAWRRAKGLPSVLESEANQRRIAASRQSV